MSVSRRSFLGFLATLPLVRGWLGAVPAATADVPPAPAPSRPAPLHSPARWCRIESLDVGAGVNAWRAIVLLPPQTIGFWYDRFDDQQLVQITMSTPNGTVFNGVARVTEIGTATSSIVRATLWGSEPLELVR